MILIPSDLVPSYHGRLPICGVVATAVACNITFQQARNHIARWKGANWKGGMYDHEVVRAVNELGGNIVQDKSLTVNFIGHSIAKFVLRNWITGDGNAYLVRTGRHFQVVQGRKVVDQQGIKDISDYHFKKARVVTIYRVDSIPVLKDIEIIKNTDTYKKEIEVVTKKVSKFNRAKDIVRAARAEGMGRKDILAKLTTDLETTWNAASTFYHKILKEIKAEEAAATNSTTDVQEVA